MRTRDREGAGALGWRASAHINRIAKPRYDLIDFRTQSPQAENLTEEVQSVFIIDIDADHTLLTICTEIKCGFVA